MRKPALLIIALAACLPLSFSGSSVPTDHTFKLTAEDIAAAADTSCYQEWVGADPEANRDEALRRLEARGVDIVERTASRFTMALRGQTRVGKGFWENPVAVQAVILTHELTHYCQRDDLGDDEFDTAYAHSAGRWRVEVAGHAQSIRTMKAHSPDAAAGAVAEYIDVQLVKMRDAYWLHDIEPGQYEGETRKVWEAAAQ